MDILEQLDSGTRGLKYFIQSYKDDFSLKGDLGRERYVQMLDVLYKALGDNNRVIEYLEYKRTNKLETYGEVDEYTKDRVYGDIKELEFLKEYLDNHDNKREELRGLSGGVGDALELYAYLFNNWEIYEDVINQGLTLAQEEPAVEEYAYEDLIDTGVTPRYTDVEPTKEEPKQPTSRVERRKQRRSGK